VRSRSPASSRTSPRSCPPTRSWRRWQLTSTAGSWADPNGRSSVGSFTATEDPHEPRAWCRALPARARQGHRLRRPLRVRLPARGPGRAVRHLHPGIAARAGSPDGSLPRRGPGGAAMNRTMLALSVLAAILLVVLFWLLLWSPKQEELELALAEIETVQAQQVETEGGSGRSRVSVSVPRSSKPSWLPAKRCCLGTPRCQARFDSSRPPPTRRARRSSRSRRAGPSPWKARMRRWDRSPSTSNSGRGTSRRSTSSDAGGPDDLAPGPDLDEPRHVDRRVPEADRHPCRAALRRAPGAACAGSGGRDTCGATPPRTGPSWSPTGPTQTRGPRWRTRRERDDAGTGAGPSLPDGTADRHARRGRGRRRRRSRSWPSWAEQTT
jgi:hypothetical protein